MNKIAIGGGCHWCTEAVFQSLKGVERVDQGFVAAAEETNSYSEAVVVHFDSAVLSLKDLIRVHVHTHASRSNHDMRDKYRSAIYTFTSEQKFSAQVALNEIQKEFDKPLITRVFPFKDFRPSDERYRNYYLRNPQKPFCKTYIAPKLKMLSDNFPDQLEHVKEQMDYC